MFPARHELYVYVKLGYNKHSVITIELGYNEQNIHSQMIIYHTNQPGYNEPQTNLVGNELFVMINFDCR